nr:MAG TPA: hypothetical protein [Caudoviricetes sp.]
MLFCKAIQLIKISVFSFKSSLESLFNENCASNGSANHGVVAQRISKNPIIIYHIL